MNKRVQEEIGETIVEKRGWHWALTSFTFEIWGGTQENTEYSMQRAVSFHTSEKSRAIESHD